MSYVVDPSCLQPIWVGLAASEPVTLLHCSVAFQQLFVLCRLSICAVWILWWWWWDFNTSLDAHLEQQMKTNVRGKHFFMSSAEQLYCIHEFLCIKKVQRYFINMGNLILPKCLGLVEHIWNKFTYSDRHCCSRDVCIFSSLLYFTFRIKPCDLVLRQCIRWGAEFALSAGPERRFLFVLNSVSQMSHWVSADC